MRTSNTLPATFHTAVIVHLFAIISSCGVNGQDIAAYQWQHPNCTGSYQLLQAFAQNTCFNATNMQESNAYFCAEGLMWGRSYSGPGCGIAYYGCTCHTPEDLHCSSVASTTTAESTTATKTWTPTCSATSIGMGQCSDATSIKPASSLIALGMVICAITFTLEFCS
ncbi:hypothetical protein DFS34DRAFT_290414 [Phlyctochytrium arcticum]|nr:hypothetical protein DFS34DRAFT_290414 [Phlyctochytrium arcticum]